MAHIQHIGLYVLLYLLKPLTFLFCVSVSIPVRSGIHTQNNINIGSKGRQKFVYEMSIRAHMRPQSQMYVMISRLSLNKLI